MKALTLHQPWASLVAMGAKTIETRSWSTNYRGPLAIHAGKHRPSLMYLPNLPRYRPRPDPLEHRRFLVIDTITDPRYTGPQPQGRRVPKTAQTPTLFFPSQGPHGRPWDPDAGTSATEQGTAILLPLGAVVATCELVDVVPIVDGIHYQRGDGRGDRWPPDERVCTTAINPALILVGGNTPREDVGSQRPFGDFSPGRFAWLLDEIKPLDPPVPFTGRQGLWEWPC